MRTLLRKCIGFYTGLNTSRQHCSSISAASNRRQLRFEQCEDRCLLAVLTVNSPLDNTIGGDGFLTLREAVYAANADDLPDTIDFSSSLFQNGDVTITLTDPNGELWVTDDLTIEGPETGKTLGDPEVYDLTISGDNTSRIFYVDHTSFMISGLKLTDGYGGSVGAGAGGAIASWGSDITIEDTEISDNSAIYGGGLLISSAGNEIHVSIEDCTISGNHSTDEGGGLQMFLYDNSSAEFLSTTISGNTAGIGDARPGAIGGGAYVSVSADSDFTLINSTVSGNDSYSFAGGLYLLNYGDIDISQCTISDNRSIGGSGGLRVRDLGSGKTTISHSTIVFNEAGFDEGLVDGSLITRAMVTGGGLTVVGDCYATSTSAPTTRTEVKHTIIAHNEDNVGMDQEHNPEDYQLDMDTNNLFIKTESRNDGQPIAQQRISAEYCLIEDIRGGSNFLPSNNEISEAYVVGWDPENPDPTLVILGPFGRPVVGDLQDNGGPTETCEPIPGGPAVDAGEYPYSGSETSDQRGEGYARVADGDGDGTARIDIGAVELVDTGPRVINVRLNGVQQSGATAGQDWDASAIVDFSQLIPEGEQLRTVYTGGVKTIEVVFTQNVSIVKDNLQFMMNTTGEMAPVAKSLDGVGFELTQDDSGCTAKWTFPTVLDDGKYALKLRNVVNPITGKSLDGDWANPDYSSPDYYQDDIYDPEYKPAFITGDGTAGSINGEFRFHFALLAGDYDGDGVVEYDDTLGSVEAERLDGNGDGVIEEVSDDYVVEMNEDARLSLMSIGDADYNDDDVIDALDLAVWKATFGTLPVEEADLDDGDANGDGAVNLLDLNIWKAQFGLSGDDLPKEGPVADFDDDGDVDLDDLTIWQQGFGTGLGDANGDLDVDIYDLMAWQSSFSLYSPWYVKPENRFAESTYGDYAPWVTDVVISGSASIHDPYSFSTVVDGSGDQLTTVPVGGADTVSIVFSEAVNVSASSLSVVGLTQSVLPVVTEFSYDAATFTATWRLENWDLHADQYLITLADSVTDVDGNWLDGDWTNPQSVTTSIGSASTFPSGDGNPGGNFEFIVTLFPGDADLDNDVDMDDWNIFAANMGSLEGTFTTADFSGDGIVSLFDDGFQIVFYMDCDLQTVSLLADLDGDWNVDGDDLQLILDNLGMADPDPEDGDLDADGDIDMDDLDLAFAQFGIDLDLVA